MILIHKGTAPPSLVRAGKKHAKQLCAAYDAEPKSYRSGERKMNIRKSIYASTVVRAALTDCHYGKCCYCETRIPEPYADMHVEHWRPKSSSRQSRNDKSIWPGYYWLAYDWDNLLLSCAYCNRDHKKDLFPLKNPEERATHHAMSIKFETPSIIKPDGVMDPRDHITFHRDNPVALTTLGRTTIEVLKLDSPKHGRIEYLKEEIDKRLELYSRFKRIRHPTAQEYAERARKFIEDAVRPEKSYSAMVAAYLAARKAETGKGKRRARTPSKVK